MAVGRCHLRTVDGTVGQDGYTGGVTSEQQRLPEAEGQLGAVGGTVG